MQKVTVIGGGTGTFVVLSGLKEKQFDLGVIVSMMDSGGSTGRLRDQLEVLPPGDLRQCLVAMSEAPLLWRKLFLYRFENGDLKGHNFGNIFLSALEKVTGDYSQVLEQASYVLKTKGPVLPVTFDKTTLCVEYESGAVLKGEGTIDEDNNEQSRIVKAYLEPTANPNPDAIQRIKESDVLVIGPGDLYTSIIPVLLVDGVKDAIIERNPKVIYISNIMTKTGQTTHYKASTHVHDLERYLGKEPDYVVLNTEKIPDDLEKWYNSHNEEVVFNDLHENGYRGAIVESELLDSNEVAKSAADTLSRSLVRHDSQKLAEVLASIIHNETSAL